MATIAMLAGSALVTGVFFVGAWQFAVRRRHERFAMPYGAVLAVCGVLSIFVNPFSNIILGFTLDDCALAAARRSCINATVDSLYASYGSPDAVWTNEHGVFVVYRNTSPFFSMYKQDTMALVSNSVTVAIWNDD